MAVNRAGNAPPTASKSAMLVCCRSSSDPNSERRPSGAFCGGHFTPMNTVCCVVLGWLKWALVYINVAT